MTETELIGSIRRGLIEAGLSETEASELSAGLAVAPSLRQCLSHDLEAGARLAVTQAADIGRAIASRRAREAQDEQAARMTAEAQQQNEADARLSRAVIDPVYDRLWSEIDPDGHRAAWRSYLARKRSDPNYRIR